MRKNKQVLAFSGTSKMTGKNTVVGNLDYAMNTFADDPKPCNRKSKRYLGKFIRSMENDNEQEYTKASRNTQEKRKAKRSQKRYAARVSRRLNRAA